jgi:hypothetical protein
MSAMVQPYGGGQGFGASAAPAGHDRGALRREGLDDGPSDAAPAAGDDGDAARKPAQCATMTWRMLV